MYTQNNRAKSGEKTPGRGFLSHWFRGSNAKHSRKRKLTHPLQRVFIRGATAVLITSILLLTFAPRAHSAAPSAEWWDGNYLYREKISVTAGSTNVPTDYSVRIEFDHAALVAAGKSLSSGNDIRIAYWNGSTWTELDRLLDDQSSWNSATTQVWFRTQAAINADETVDDYYLYYGYGSAGSPPTTWSNVFLFYDDFNDGSFDTGRWTCVSGPCTESGGNLTLGTWGKAWATATYAFGTDTRWETRVRLANNFAQYFNYCAAANTSDWSDDWIDMWSTSSAHQVETAVNTVGGSDVYTNPSPTSFHVYAFNREGASAVRFYQDTTQIGYRTTDIPGANLRFLSNNDNDTSSQIHDWVRVRKYVSPEPTNSITKENICWSSELLTNPGFETGDATGWSNGGGGNVNIGDHCVACDDGPRTGSYQAYWNTSGSGYYLYQTVDLSSYASDIDAGNAVITATGWLISNEYPAQDLFNMQVRFYDGTLTEIVGDRYDTGTKDVAAWGEYGIQAYTIPTGARSVEVRFNTWEVGYDAGSADDFSVKVGTPCACSPISFDAASNSTGDNENLDTFSWSHTVSSSGSDRILVVGVSWRNGGAGTQTVNTVTYNSQPLTLIRKDEKFDSESRSSALYYLTDPPTGSAYTIQVNFSGLVYRSVGGAVSLTGVDQSDPVDAQNGVAGALPDTNPSVTVTTNTDGAWVVDALCIREASGTTSVSGGQAERWNYRTTGNNIDGAGSTMGPKSSAGDVTMSWTTGTNEGYSMSVAALKPACSFGGGGGGSGISFVGSDGVTGNATGASFSFDIGSAGTDRLVVLIADDESAGNDLTGVTVDGKSCNLVTIAENTVTGTNHQEMWYCDEDDLGASSGSVTVAITAAAGTGWALHAHLYTGVDQGGPTDFGIDNTSVDTTVTVPGIDVPANGLVVMGAAEGTQGCIVNTWTSPLGERTNSPDPSSADLITASGIESSAQTDKTYIATFDCDFNRGTGIAASWPEASPGVVAYDQDSFRARNDNGDETTSTWTAAANSNWTQMVDKNFRVRFLVQETGGVADPNKSFQLEYNLNGAGWNDVTGSSLVVETAATANVNDGADTTQQLGSGTYVSTNAGFDESDGQVGGASLDFSGSDEVEVEFSLQIVSADVSNGDTIELRVKGLDTYTTTPTVTVTGAGTFLYKKSIEIQEAEVTCTSNVSNFPAMVQLTGADFQEVEDDVDADGFDIIFKAEDDATCGGAGLSPCILDHEIELYDETNDKLVAWVRVPVLDFDNNTTIYLYYGNAVVTAATQNPTGVWDDDYVVVQHMNGNAYTAVDDSTSNNNDVTIEVGDPTYQSTGQMGYAVDFDGNDAVEIPDSLSLDLTSQLTISAWIRPTSILSYDRIVAKSHTSASAPWTIYGLLFDNATHLRGEVASGGSQNGVDGTTGVPLDPTWTYASVTYNGTDLRVYFNNSSENFTGPIGGIDTNDMPLSIARSGYDGDYFNGRIDEVRVSKIARDACWIESEYSNQNTPASFYTVGSQTSTISPQYDQDSFRARNDNGDEASSTWTAAADTNWTQMVDKNFRVRFLVQETAGGADSGKTFQLEYNRNSGGWNDVTGSSSVVKSNATANVTDGVDTTQQVGSGTYVSTNAGFDEANGQVGSMDFAGTDEVEVEFSLQIVGSDVSNGDTIELRVKGLDTYTSTPTVTVTGAGTFLYKKSIEIQEAEVTCTSNVSNMPVMVQLTGAHFQEVEDDVDPDGFDIIFKAEDDATCGGTGMAPCILDHEIEVYDETNDLLVAWVRIPVLDYNNNTTIYLYYGNAAVTAATENPTGVWDSNFQMVQHLRESSGTLYDSTSNDNDGTRKGVGEPAYTSSGNIDGAQDFDGNTVDDDYIEVATNAWSASAGTVEAWVETDGVTADGLSDYIFGHTTQPSFANRIQIYLYDQNRALAIGLGDQHERHINIQTFAIGTWYHVVLTWDGTNYEVFVDGVSKANGSYSGLSSMHTSADIGNNGNPATRGESWNGIMDEFRVSDIARDACWIETEHTNQDTPASFYIVGSQESGIPSAEYDQDSFRARNDNGDEATSTWTAAADTNWTQMVDKNFRVRFLVQETAGIADSGKTFQLEYNLNGGGWNDVTDSSSVVKATATTNVTDGANTTQQLGSGTYVSTNAGFDEANGQVGSMDFAGTDEVEVEFSLQIVGADVSNGNTIQLRIKGLDTYTNTPTVTVTGAGTFGYKKAITIDKDQVGTSCTSTTDTWQVSANNRDAWDDGTGDLDSCGFGDTNYYDAGGYQWAVDIPQGATITSAKVRVYSNSHSGATGAYTARIRVEDVPNASPFTGAGNDIYTARTYWGTTVDWNIPAGGLPTGTWSESPDISSLVQHIVNNGSWIPGNFLSIAIWGQTANGGCIENINDYFNNPTNAAQLEVTYQTGSGSIQDFPVMVELTGTHFQEVEDNVDPDGFDIIFKAEDDATCGGAGLAPCILDHEIEAYDETNDMLIAWVRVPTLSATADTTIYMCYGNSGVTAATQNPTGVWDNSFREVFHLHEDSGTLYDSTVNGYTGATGGNATQGVAGKISKAVEFDGSAGSQVSLSDGSMASDQTFTFSAWVWANTIQNEWEGIVSKGRNSDDDWQGLWINGSNLLSFGWELPDGNVDGSTLSSGQWYYVAATYDGTNRRLYLNNALDGGPSPGGPHDTDISENTLIGEDERGSVLDGIVDEVRISNVARDLCWVQTEFSNQNSPSTFYGVGGEVPIAVANLTQTHYRWRNDDGGETGTSSTITVEDTDYNTTISDTLTISSFTVQGSNRLMMVGVSINNDGYESVSSVTWNGSETFTKIRHDTFDNDSRTEIWYLKNPTATTASVVVTFSAVLAQEAIAGVVTFTGADLSDTFRNDNGNSWDTLLTPSISVDTAVDDMVFGVVADEYEDIVSTTADTEHWHINNYSSFSAAGGTKAGAASSTTISWTLAVAQHCAISAVSIKPAPGGTAATFAEAEDTKLTDLNKGTLRRLRFEVSNEGVLSSGGATYQLQVAETGTCGSGSYAAVPTDSSGHWQIVDSSYITDGEQTYDNSGLTNEASTWVDGELKDAGNTTGSITLGADEFTEIEFAIQATTNATDGGDYCFRLYDTTGGSSLDTYSVYAEASLLGPSDVTQIHYRWRNDDGPERMQATETADDTTDSTTDVPVSGMTLTLGAGDYHVWFSGSVESSATSYQYVSLYVGGTKIAHTERQIRTEGSIPNTSFPVATHARIIGVTAGQTIEVRWRTTAGTATMHERTLLVAPIVAADSFQASETADDTTMSTTDELVPGMTLIPGAGDYHIWFSGSVECDTDNTNQYVSLYVNGVQIPHTERRIHTEGSIPATSFPVATHARVTGVTAGQAIEVQWRTTGVSTATMHERTLVVSKINAADSTQASETGDDTTGSATDVLVTGMTLTPTSDGDYRIWFSGSVEGTDQDSTQYVSLYLNNVQIGHSERQIFTEESIQDTSFPVATHAYVTGVTAGQDVEVRWRTTAGTATMHERTLVIEKVASSGAATFAEAEDTKLDCVDKGDTIRLRFAISNEGAQGSGAVTYQLQVAETATCGSGTYSAVPTDSSGHWQIVDSTYVSDGESTSDNSGLTNEGSTWVDGELRDTGNTTGSITLNPGEFTEIEFALQATANATEPGDYCFRLYDTTSGQALDTYSVYPEVAICGGPDLTQIHYRWRNDDAGEAGDAVFTVQSYQGTMGAQSSVAVPITAVSNLDRAFILAPAGNMSAGRGSLNGNQNANEVLVRARFTATDEVTLTRGESTNDSSYSFFVIEDKTGNEIYVKSGSTAFTGNTDADLDIDIGAGITDYTKTVVFLTVSSDNAGVAGYNEAHVRGRMTSNTNLELRRTAANSIVTVDWFVVEFKGSGWGVQQGQFSLSTGTEATPETQAISSVTMADTFVFMNWSADTNGLDQTSAKVELTDATTLSFSRQDTAAGICTVNYFVVSHSDLDVQRGSDYAAAGDSTEDQTITAVDTTTAFPITFNDCNGTGTAFPRPYWRAWFSNSTTLNWDRSYTGQDANFFWQVIDLSGFVTTAATFAADEDTKLTGLSKGSNIRLRFGVSNEGILSSGGATYQLQVAETATCGSGTYTAVPTDASGHWQIVDSTYITDGEATVDNSGLTNEAATWVDGELKDAGNTTGSITLDTDAFTEIEFAIQATTNATDGGDYCFRLYDSTGGAALDTYSVYAEVSIGGPNIVQTHYRWRNDDGGESGGLDTGDGADGALAPAGTFNLNESASGSRTYADGVAVGVTANPATQNISVDSTDGIAAGDEVLLINLQGTASDNADVGNYELLEVTGVSGGNTVTVQSAPTKSYDGNNFANQKVILQRVPNYTDITLDSTDSITATAWDGLSTTGNGNGRYATGIVVFRATGTVSVGATASISVDGSGYRGGPFNTAATPDTWRYIGEGFIGGYGTTGSDGSSNSEGGGPGHSDGDNDINTGIGGGGGGGYATSGSNGTITQGTGFEGLGGGTYGDAALTQLFLGSAGGSGGHDTDTSTRNGGAGGNGGGILYIIADTISVSGTISSNGDPGNDSTDAGCGGGGGSGGSILLEANSVTVGTTTANGSSGGIGLRSCDGGASGDGRIHIGADIINGTTSPLADESGTPGGGSEASFAEIEDGKLNGLAIQNTIRLRFLICNQGTQTTGPITYELQMAETDTCGSGTYSAVPTTASGPSDYWEIVDSSYITDGEQSFDNAGLTNSCSTWVDGEVRDNANVTGTITLNANEFTEIEFVLQASEYSTDGGDYCFRLYDTTNGAALGNYAEYGEVQLANGIFSYRKPITIPAANLGGSCSADLDDFPILISLTDPDLASKAKADGYDIIFRALDNTICDDLAPAPCTLDHEIEKWDSGTGELIAWVRIPKLSSSSDTTIYMYYGNPNVYQSTENAAAVWGPEYMGVWHLNESSGNAQDSTSYGTSGAISGTVTQGSTGNIDYAYDFNTSGEVNCGDPADGHLDGGTGSWTVSIWVNIDVNRDQWEQALYKGGTSEYGHGYAFEVYSGSSDLLFVINDGSAQWGYSKQTPFTEDTWHHVVGVVDRSNNELRIYRDGVEQGTATDISAVGNIDSTNDLAFSKDWGWMDGLLDEVHISAVARNDCWIETSFASQDNPGDIGSPGFYSVGGEEGTPSTAVSLLSFTARGQGSSVLVEWETAQEIRNVGFNLYRSEKLDGPFTRLNDRLIPGLTFSVRGKSYSFVDTDATSGTLYYYKLEDIDVSGERTMHGPISVDWDADGMPDDWEIAYGFNPWLNDANDDPDGDGLTNLEEYDHETDPLNPDSDGDGIPDGLESGKVERGEPVETRTLTKGVQIVASDDSGVTLEIRTDNYEMEVIQVDEDVFQRLRISDYIHGFTGEIGRPELPMKGLLLDLPDGVSATLNVEATESQTLAGYWIYPVPEKAVSGEEGSEHVAEFFAIDEAAYSSDAFYPAVVAELGQSYLFRDQQKLQVRFYPFAFNPTTKELTHYKRIRVRVEYEVASTTTRSVSRALALPVPSSPTPITRALGWTPPSPNRIYKILVSEEGLYRMTGTWLAANGVKVTSMALDQIRLYNLGQEIPIHVYDGGVPGQFDSTDYIEFYGRAIQAPYAKYTKQNAYWLTDSGVSGGLRMGFIDGTPVSVPLLTHTSTVHYEEDVEYVNSAPGTDALDRWYFSPIILGDAYDPALGGGVPVPFTLPLSEIAGQVSLKMSLCGVYDMDHEVEVRVEDSIGGVKSTGTSIWSGIAYHEATMNVNLADGDKVVIECKSENGMDAIMVDWFEATYLRNLVARNDTLRFSHGAGSAYQVSGFSGSEILAFDITAATDVRQIINSQTTDMGGSYILDMEPQYGTGDRTYLVLSTTELKLPVEITEVVDPDLSNGANGADYILITHRDLGWDVNGDPYEWLNNLTALRQSQGLRVKVVDVEDIYNEFGYGIVTPQAIKDFLSHAYDNWTRPAPQYVLLVGDSTYDYKDNLNLSTINYVPTYLSWTDYMGETLTDDWFARVSGNDAVPDLYIGRLPAASEAQAAAMVNKIVGYESTVNTKTWEKNTLLVSDDQTEDYEAIFEIMSNDVAALIPQGMSSPFTEYLADYPDPADLTATIKDKINNAGTLMVNYSGHGSVQIWTLDPVFEVGDVADLTNSGRLPFFVSMTCLTGFFGYPEAWDYPSLAEVLLRSAKKGAVAAFMSTGMTQPESQHILVVALFDAIFTQDIRTLGPAISSAKQTLLANGAEHEDVSKTFLLFGDPATKLKIPLPTVPSGLVAEVQGSSVVLTWQGATDANGGAIAGYNVYRSTTPGGPYTKVNTALITGTGFTDTSAQTGTFYYVVKSVDSDGYESVPSTELVVLAGARTVSTTLEGGAGGGGGGGGCFISTIAN